jgi:hypothetical protein
MDDGVLCLYARFHGLCARLHFGRRWRLNSLTGAFEKNTDIK